MALTGSRLVARARRRRPETRRYYQQLTRLSAAFAFLADVSMLVLGGSLKRRERLSARLGDVLSMLYLASCALKRYETRAGSGRICRSCTGRVQDALSRAADALHLVLANHPTRVSARCCDR